MGLLPSRSRSQWRFKMSECLSRWYCLNRRTFCYQLWYGDETTWAKVWCRFFCFFALFKVKVTARAHMIKIWLLYFDSLATKLGLMIHHHKPECPVKKIGLLHSGSRSQRRVSAGSRGAVLGNKLCFSCSFCLKKTPKKRTLSMLVCKFTF